MKAKEITITQTELHEMFDYHDGHLLWKASRGRAKKGDQLGCPHKSGYRTTLLNKQNYAVHRLIYIYHNGSIDVELQIDHINDDKTDNHIENLRLVTSSENCIDRDKDAKGCSWHKNLQRWIAQIKRDGVNMYLGCYENESDAIEAYQRAR